MPSESTGLSESEAQRMMSRLLDGELSSKEAESLHEYLEDHPEAMDWMESCDLVENAATDRVISNEQADAATAWESISREIFEEREDPDNASNLIFFPLLFKVAGIAAAITLVATLLWFNLAKNSEQMTERYAASESVVEFVDTDIPDASPIVYTDEQSGWTVVWVTEMDPISDETG